MNSQSVGCLKQSKCLVCLQVRARPKLSKLGVLCLSKLFLIYAIFVLTACSSSGPNTETDKHDFSFDYRNHSIFFGADGRFLDPDESQRTANLPAAESLLSNIKRVKDRAADVASYIENNPIRLENGNCVQHGTKKKIVIFVHGGLNTLQGSKKSNKKRAIAMHNDCYNSVFINWRSGLFSSYGEHLTKWREDYADNSSLVNTPFVFATDALSMVAEAPRVWGTEAFHSLSSTALRRSDFGFEIGELAETPYADTIILPVDPRPSGNWQRALLWLVTSPAKIISTPAVSKVGGQSWDEMRSRAMSLAVLDDNAADNALNNSCLKSVSSSAADLQDCNLRGEGMAKIFLAELSRKLRFDRNDPDSDCNSREGENGVLINPGACEDRKEADVSVKIVGHSMGSIVVNELLRALPNVQIDEVVHMASADSTERVVSVANEFLTSHPLARWHNLYLHPDVERREMRAKGFAPSGSLLVWIDNMFINPSTFLDRTAGQWENAVRGIYQYRHSVACRVRHRIFTARPTSPDNSVLRHGDFSDRPFWTDSFLHGNKDNLDCGAEK